MATHASGTFDVKISQQTANEIETAAEIGRMTIDKELHGDLEATSKGEMLTTGDPKGSAVYVALERVTGTLNGRSGTFVLQHSASMTRTSQQLLITVAPDSGTGQLIGLTGKFNIKIVDKRHFYDFEYSLPAEN
jgi:LDH2 family malate/lactate/ureidoglycolate dehydrogenase